MRRSPLRRHTPLERAAGHLIRKAGLSPTSPKRQREAVGRAVVRSVVFERDGWRCLLASEVAPVPGLGPFPLGRCRGLLTPHHCLKASQGGLYEASNLLTLCARHNDAIEDNPGIAHALGLVIRRGEDHAEAAARRVKAGIGP